MKYFIGVTDNEWYSYLASLKPEEVNFWRPSGMGFKAIDVGSPFLFKLHSPLNYITGGGFFVKAEKLPLSIAWKVFGNKNGAESFESFRKLILSHRKSSEHDPDITCIILNEPFWLDRENWIPIPKNWKKGIVPGKTYDIFDSIGEKTWNQVQMALYSQNQNTETLETDLTANDPNPVYGQEYLTRGRIGQGAFRILVTSAYNKSCAISGEKTLPVLEAGHIKPFSKSGPNIISNGILLRADLHILFDKGYITVNTDKKVEVSRKIKEEYENGRDYYKYHGNSLKILPFESYNLPQNHYLRWHNEYVYLG